MHVHILVAYSQVPPRDKELESLVALSREGTTLILDEVNLRGMRHELLMTNCCSSTRGICTPKMTRITANPSPLQSTSTT